jgi:hypothetical protein
VLLQATVTIKSNGADQGALLPPHHKPKIGATSSSSLQEKATPSTIEDLTTKIHHQKRIRSFLIVLIVDD